MPTAPRNLFPRSTRPLAAHPATMWSSASPFSEQSDPPSSSAATPPLWRAPAQLAAAPGPEKVLPQMTSPGLRIECLSSVPSATLADRMERCRIEQERQGRHLASTFSHDGSMFLVFRRPLGAS